MEGQGEKQDGWKAALAEASKEAFAAADTDAADRDAAEREELALVKN